MEEVINEEVTTKRVVKETTYRKDQRLTYFAGTVLQAVEKFIADHNAQQKIQGKVIELEAETQTFVSDLRAAIEKYAANFAETKDVEVVPEELEKEFNELTTRLQALEKDPDIKYIEAKREFQTIRERQVKLKNYYDQVKAQIAAEVKEV